MRYSIVVVTGCLAVLLSGCADSTEQLLWDQVAQLGRQKTSLTLQVEALEKEKATLSEQVETLSALDGQVRLDALSNFEKVELSKRTGLFDKDDDGTLESLIVIVVPFDDAGDKIKAAGTVEVQLWDLNADADDALLSEWNIEPEELKSKWMGLMLTDYYRLKFDVGSLINENTRELTVKVKFTDYLTGKVSRAQHVIKP